MTNDIKKAICAHQGCKKVFTPKRKWQKFCSCECKDHYWNELRREALKIVKLKTVRELKSKYNEPPDEVLRASLAEHAESME